MDAERFTEGMNYLSGVFDADTISAQKVEDRFKAYLLTLADLDGEAFLEACHRAGRTLTFFPKPAELLAAAETIATERGRSGRAEEYAERVRLSDEALERERAATFGVWDPERRVLVKADGATTAPGPLPGPEDVERKVIDLSARLVAKGKAPLALPPPLSPEEFERLRQLVLDQAAAYEAEKGTG